VVLAGWAGGAGKCIKIQHTSEIATVYGHLSRFASGIRHGVSVRQGQVIGYVGSTGLSTGPHLDYRLQVRGRFVNPLTVPKVEGPPIPEEAWPEFLALAGQRVEQLASLVESGLARPVQAASLGSDETPLAPGRSPDAPADPGRL